MKHRLLFHKPVIFLSGLGLCIAGLLIANILFGSVAISPGKILDILLGRLSDINSESYIILESRLPQAVTALFAGAALAVAGLLLQTAFNNPLAGPSILGINAGASLGVAIVMLLLGGTLGSLSALISVSGYLAVVFGAFAGAALILAVIILFSSIVRNHILLLIVGIMIGYITSSAISLLNFFATTEGVFSYTMWGMGDFSGVTLQQLPFFCITVTAGLILAILLTKPLNALLLGERYARNLGVPIRTVRMGLLICTGLLTAIVTAFCGPISFIDLAVPHLARLMLGTSNHKYLLPVTLLSGAVIALLCNLISIAPGYQGMIPLNAITPLLGAPVILYVIINQKKMIYFR